MAASSRISQRRFLIRIQSFDKKPLISWRGIFIWVTCLSSQWTSWGVVQNEHKRLVHCPPVRIQKEGLFATTPSSFKHALKRRSSWQACAAAIPPNEWPNAPTRLRSRCPAKGRTDRLVKFARVNSSRTIECRWHATQVGLGWLRLPRMASLASACRSIRSVCHQERW